jgi:hypothetical protein
MGDLQPGGKRVACKILEFQFSCRVNIILPMNLLKILLLVFLLYGPAFTPAQGIAIGQWRDHLPYNHVVSVADAGDRIYAATPYNLFYYQKSDNSVHRLTKINALSDFGIRSISYSTITRRWYWLTAIPISIDSTREGGKYTLYKTQAHTRE